MPQSNNSIRSSSPRNYAGDLSLAFPALYASCLAFRNALPTCIPAYLSMRGVNLFFTANRLMRNPHILRRLEGEFSRVFSQQIFLLDLPRSPSISTWDLPRPLTRSSTLADESPEIENAKVPRGWVCMFVCRAVCGTYRRTWPPWFSPPPPAQTPHVAPTGPEPLGLKG